ncbi:MAG TPA: HAMP domain-containing protein, partial [Thiotrichales bacterium]|nr:HAMP domain-containing protein [Thiotrichales bacterium]
MGNASSNSFIKRLSIRAKINLAVGSIFSLLLILVTSYEVHHERERLMDLAKYEVRETSTFYFDSLNTMMLTGTMDQRDILRNKMLARKAIVEARVIRGQPVIDQYGPGNEEEAPLDEQDRRALQGEESIQIQKKEGQRMLTAVVPFLATENTRGVNCLKCHEVPTGSVNGAVRISYSLSEIDRAVQRQFWLILGVNLSFFVLGLVLINLLLKSWVITPLLNISDVVRRRAEGDTMVRADPSSDDEIGGLARAFNNMADNVNAVTEREHDAAETL